MNLNSENVQAVFTECLFKEGEDTSNAIIVEGIVNNFGFHPERIKEHKDDISSMLNELPEQFQKDSGGGWSFLNACMTKRDVQWGEHQNMEQLFTLGMACKKVKSLMPRNMWSALPGGMPYYMII